MLRVIHEHRPDLIERSERSCAGEFVVDNMVVVVKEKKGSKGEKDEDGLNPDHKEDQDEGLVHLELKQYNGKCSGVCDDDDDDNDNVLFFFIHKCYQQLCVVWCMYFLYHR
jgi:hypothetical protein